MTEGLFREQLPDGIEPHPDVVDVLLQLEANGWYPHGRYGARGIRYWPENNRGKQIVIDLFFPVNEDKLEMYAANTGIPATELAKEEK
jgi:hypothetical protein